MVEMEKNGKFFFEMENLKWKTEMVERLAASNNRYFADNSK